MHADNRWLLPDGIDELLPHEAWRLEAWRRELLTIFQRWGYEPVIPPLVEYLDSLLTGVGHDLQTDTFKLMDQQSGRLLGVRADITPQVARIDAHRLQKEQPVRLCYFGSILRSRLNPNTKIRNPIQVGAELYGHSGVESDFEVLSLMLQCLDALGLQNIYIDLGHVDIFRTLSKEAGISVELENHLFDALQRKAIPEIKELMVDEKVAQPYADAFLALSELNGNEQVLNQARQILSGCGNGVSRALDELAQLSGMLDKHLPQYSLHYDLAELRGYNYHTGMVFAAFIPELGQEIAKGGRYDNIGKVFGRGRPATGFSSDIMTISRLMEDSAEPGRGAIFAPYSMSPDWMAEIKRLRDHGETVISELPGQKATATEMGCDRILKHMNNKWVVEKIES